jgi:hypothetical protein
VTETKRRLPVVKPPEPADGEPARPPWQWVGFGVVATFAAWLPLAAVVQSWASRSMQQRFGNASPQELGKMINALPTTERWTLHISMIALPMGALLIASAAGGYVVGRYGGEAGVREAVMGGAAAGLIAALIAFSAAGFTGTIVIPVAALGAYLGGKRGYRSRMRPVNM